MPSRNRSREAARRDATPTAPTEAPSSTGGHLSAAPSRAAARPTAGPRRISSPDEAAALAAHLLDAHRARPVVVVSIPSGEVEPWIDAGDIADAVKDLAEVVVLPTDSASWRFSELMPEMTQVYGGAGRVYPTDLSWTTNPYASPLRFAYDAAEGARSTQALISDALRMAHDAGLVAPERTPTIPATGVLKQVVAPSRGLVQLADGSLASLWQELTAPNVPVDRLLAPGMVVRGELDPQSRRLDVTSMLRSGPEAVAHYRPDDVVLAQVRDVRPDLVHLALHPGIVLPVPKGRVTGNPLDSLNDLFSVGEVVAARVMRADEDGLALRLDDIDEDDEPLPAPALLSGGPPWLLPPVVEVPEVAPVVVPAAAVPAQVNMLSAVHAPAPAPSAPRGAARDLSLTLDAARATITRLERELLGATARTAPADREIADLRRAVQEHRDEVQRLREQVARQKTALRTRLQSASKVRRAAPRPAGDDAAASREPDHSFRLDVYDAWLARYSLPEREEHPLAPYRLGPEFLATLDTLEGVPRTKVLDVVVEVLTGLAASIPGRELHPLRTGHGGGDPQRQRADGAQCWRVALQVGTPSARRLHYWQLDGRIELASLRVHDDMRP